MQTRGLMTSSEGGRLCIPKRETRARGVCGFQLAKIVERALLPVTPATNDGAPATNDGQECPSYDFLSEQLFPTSRETFAGTAALPLPELQSAGATFFPIRG